LELRDLTAYLDWMHTKYKGLWNQYTSERFRAARRTNANARLNGQPPAAMTYVPIEDVIETTDGPVVLSTTPNFKAFPKRRSYCVT